MVTQTKHFAVIKVYTYKKSISHVDCRLDIARRTKTLCLHNCIKSYVTYYQNPSNSGKYPILLKLRKEFTQIRYDMAVKSNTNET
jgi:hypothetical protein